MDRVTGYGTVVLVSSKCKLGAVHHGVGEIGNPISQVHIPTVFGELNIHWKMTVSEHEEVKMLTL